MLCAYLYPPGDPGFETLRDKAAQLQAPLIGINDRGPLDWRVALALLRICRDEQVAIWHGHDYKSNLLGLMLARFHRMRLVTTLHGWGVRSRRTQLYYAIDRLCLTHYERVIGVSPDLVVAGLRAGVSRRRCLLLENGIDLTANTRTRSTADAKALLGIPRESFVIGAVGRLSEEKGFDLLIRAVHELRRHPRDIRLLVIGEGDQRSLLEKRIYELGLRESVRLTGFQADPRPYYEAMDVYALSSLREGLPNVLLEAFAYELPVVATRIAGVPRVVTDGVNGRLIEPGRVEALAAAFEELVSDPDKCAEWGRTGRRTVEDRFSFARRMDRLADWYDEWLDD